MNLVDKYCSDCFPELVEIFGLDALEEASGFGSYIFHEDYFVKWMKGAVLTPSIIERITKYMEYLAESPNSHLNDLAHVGLLESVVDVDLVELAPYMGAETKKLLVKVCSTMHLDPDIWLV
ncbi:MAG: hypothetical protein COB40_14420 [Marinosulfonomonas sp.]|nr:MAG: hypothetical protein COB40_14420 [Marinosulfonomonas sp.]